MLLPALKIPKIFKCCAGFPQAQFTIQSLHGTYLAPGQSSVGALRREDYHAMWGVGMGAGGTVCLRGTIKGQYLWALEDKKGVTMMPLCIEHAQLTPVVLSRGGHTEDDYDTLDLAQILEFERQYGGVDGAKLRLQDADKSAEDQGLNYTSLYPEEVFAQMQNNGWVESRKVASGSFMLCCVIQAFTGQQVRARRIF